MCNKKCREAGTREEDFMDTISNVTAVFFLVYPFPYYIIAMLEIISKQHSKAEPKLVNLKSVGELSMKMRGPIRQVVAIKLDLLLKVKKLVMVFLPRLLYNFAIINPFAECNWIPWVVFTGSKLKTSPTKVMHDAGVAAKDIFMVKFVNLVIISSRCLLYSAECNWNPCLVFTGSYLRTSPSKVLHHAGVEAMRVSKALRKQMKKMARMRKLFNKKQKPNLLLVRMLQLYEVRSQFGFCSIGSLSFRTCGSLQNLSQQL